MDNLILGRARCEEAVSDELQDITTHDAAPYDLHHPDGDSLGVPTVVLDSWSAQ